MRAMKSSVMCSLIAVAAMGVGIGVGWILWGGRTEPQSSGRIPRAAALVQAASGGNRATCVAQSTMERTACMVSAELEKMKSMSVPEYAAQMSNVWLSSKVYGDNYVKKALYASVCEA